ncbi:YeaC family protein [Shewanella surugensis]|uniref:DUF1315 family protein n=1 Tax=Shewanella surugensis TaxID=212020 RepID=A0ABT0LDB1_9GAMM|nr:DUF1315 family protein [Shewanella surugensis]MCL1125702.1 DUF1315 family protein [Shewanella surugensis]
MKDISQVIEEMPQEVYERLISAVELGKWEDGTVLSDEQRASTQQVVMLYQAKKLHQTDHFTIGREGQINELSKAQLKKEFKAADFKGESIAAFKNDDL